MTDSGATPRRRRRRSRHAEASEQPAAADQPAADRPEPAPAAKPRRPTGRAAENPPARDSDRGWRELLGNAPSQVGVSGAMRARDVARPGAAELAAAEQDLVIVRRQWKPPEESGR